MVNEQQDTRACRGSEAVTRGFRVSVEPAYVAEQSRPEAPQFVFSYHIRITNESTAPAKLLRRHWLIVDSDGERRDVEGEGVIGKQPLIGPGESFEYQSFCPLPTDWGTMEGTYLMEQEDGERFEIEVSRFYLVAGVQPSPV